MGNEVKKTILHLENVTVSYEKVPVLWDVSFEIPEGELVGILGPNGAGKSTLLKTVLGFINPIVGKISFWGNSLKDVQKKLAYIPQKESVDWDFPITVRELVLMGRYGTLGFFKHLKPADFIACDHYLKVVGLTQLADRQIGQLSGGQKQRAFIARALIQEADVYFLDEPFAGVDAATEQVLVNLLKSLALSGKTIFIVHHDLNMVSNLFSWTLLLNLRLIASGKTSEVFTAKNIEQAYGKNYSLLGDAIKLASDKKSGAL